MNSIEGNRKSWWQKIASSNEFTDKVCNYINRGCSIVIYLPSHTPFKEEFHEIIKLKLDNGVMRFEKKEYPEDGIGQFLLDNYCSNDTKSEYRSNKCSHAKFLSDKSTLLKDTLIYFQNIDECIYEEIAGFMSEYRGDGLFIFEINGSIEKLKTSIKEEKIIEYTIKRFDVYSYCILLASEVEVKDDYFRNYLAELAYNICGDKVELCMECMGKGDGFISDPVKTFKEIVNKNDLDSHTIDEAKLKKAIRQAQVREFYPIIENFRGSFLEKHREKIEKILPLSSLPYENKTIEGLNDLDIGAIDYICKNLIETAYKDRKEVSDVKKIRNSLSHFGVISKEQMKFLYEVNKEINEKSN